MGHMLENLGPDRFQQLVQALLVAEFPGVGCFPIGQPDGGRDAVKAQPEPGKFIVFQVKFTRTPASVADVGKWLLARTADEAEKVARLIKRGASTYVLVSNVPGTGSLDTGTIDKLQTLLSQRFQIPVTCWWRDDIDRRLDNNWDVKLRYPEILDSHDFFRILVDTVTGQDKERRANAIRAFLADQYRDDVDVKFKQVELHTKLLDLFIDLPFRLSVPEIKWNHSDFPSQLSVQYHGDETGKALSLSNSQEDASTSGTATLLLSEFGYHNLSQLVIEGAPGQGKSTLAQYLCQVHRIRLLDKLPDLARLSDADKQSAVRLPMKVDLRDLATWLGGADPFLSNNPAISEMPSLESFLAHLVRRHSGGIRFDVNDLLEIAKSLPLLVVLDGLDEVADIKQRADVVGNVTKSVTRLREACPDLGIIITSRPAAFVNSPGFDPQHFKYIDLLSVKRSQIDEYAGRWMNIRGLSPKEQEEFRAILREKMNAPHLRDLARNPMQLTILLSLILTQGSALPDKRTSLYDAYVDLFFGREAAKDATVRMHIDLLKDLHRYIGWALHSMAETDHKSSGRISAEDLKALLQRYLSSERHDTAVIDEIFGAMLARVVMIVPRIQGTYEFEVQPLREYFAARYLYNTAS